MLVEAIADYMRQRVRWSTTETKHWRQLPIQTAQIVLESARSAYYRTQFMVLDSAERFDGELLGEVGLGQEVLDAIDLILAAESWDDVPIHFKACDCDLCLALE